MKSKLLMNKQHLRYMSNSSLPPALSRIWPIAVCQEQLFLPWCQFSYITNCPSPCSPKTILPCGVRLLEFLHLSSLLKVCNSYIWCGLQFQEPTCQAHVSIDPIIMLCSKMQPLTIHLGKEGVESGGLLV